MVNAASSATDDTRETTEDIWRGSPLDARDFEPDIPIAGGVSDSLITDVTHLDEQDDGFSSQVAILLETDVDVHLRKGGRGGEQQEQTEGQFSAHVPRLLIR